MTVHDKHSQVLHCQSEQGAAEAPPREIKRVLRVPRLLQEGENTGTTERHLNAEPTRPVRDNGVV